MTESVQPVSNPIFATKKINLPGEIKLIQSLKLSLFFTTDIWHLVKSTTAWQQQKTEEMIKIQELKYTHKK